MSPSNDHTLSASLRPEIKRVVVSAGLIRAPKGHPHAGKILMTKRLADAHLANAWEFPGGKVELGEDPVSALHRELREELEIEVHNARIFSVGHHVYDVTKSDGQPKAKDVILMVYDCELLSGDPKCIGVADFAWLSPQEVCALPLPPADEEIITRLREEMSGGGE